MIVRLLLWLYHTFIYHDKCRFARYDNKHSYQTTDVVKLQDQYIYEIQKCINCDKLRKVRL